MKIGICNELRARGFCTEYSECSGGRKCVIQISYCPGCFVNGTKRKHESYGVFSEDGFYIKGALLSGGEPSCLICVQREKAKKYGLHFIEPKTKIRINELCEHCKYDNNCDRHGACMYGKEFCPECKKGEFIYNRDQYGEYKRKTTCGCK